MKIDAVLAGIRQLYLDTAPIIYYIETNGQYIDRMDAIFSYLNTGRMQGVCSVTVLTEVLVLPIRAGRNDLVKLYRNILLNNIAIKLAPLNAAAAEDAARLRAKYNLRTPDALQIATALDTHCDAFLTNDKGLARVSEIAILTLDNLELDPRP